MKILFVCHGNICRSPMAEYIFKYLSNNKYDVESRATSEEEIGNDIYPPIKEELLKHNIPFSKHSAKRITIDDYNSSDIVVCFDEYNIKNLERITNDISKVILLNNKEIKDPWYTRDFDTAFNDIYLGCKNLLKQIEE